LSVLSIFDAHVTLPTPPPMPHPASQRNDFAAALAAAVFVPHAVAGGKAEVVARRALARGQLVVTFDDVENSHLMEVGAIPVDEAPIPQFRSSRPTVDPGMPRR
jgi:predicted Rossmann fold nucleotide-binding protein DprA/Smf involved in DNA uptake